MALTLSFGAGADLFVVVNKNNDISELSHKAIIDIYMGRTQSFPNGRSAFPLDQDVQSELRASFYKKLVNKTLPQINAYWARLLFTGRASPPRMIMDSVQLLEAIEQNPSAIGYVDGGMLNDRVKVVAKIE